MKWVFYLVELRTHAPRDSGAKVNDLKPFYIRAKVKGTHVFFRRKKISWVPFTVIVAISIKEVLAAIAIKPSSSRLPAVLTPKF